MSRCSQRLSLLLRSWGRSGAWLGCFCLGMMTIKIALPRKGGWLGGGCWATRVTPPFGKAGPRIWTLFFPGQAQRCCLPFPPPRQAGCWRVRPPSLTGLLCGCGDAGDCGAAAETRAPEAAPRESLARAPDWEGDYRIYRGQCGTLGGGSLRACYRICPEPCSPFWEWQCQDLITCLLGVARARGGALRARGWVDCMRSSRSWGWQPGRVGCGSWVV